MNRYRCGKCPYIYDPAKGDPDGGIPPGTPFSRIPASWRCPVCGASKQDFYPLQQASDGQPQADASTHRLGTRPPAEPRVTASVSDPLQSVGLPQWTVGSLKSRR